MNGNYKPLKPGDMFLWGFITFILWILILIWCFSQQ